MVDSLVGFQLDFFQPGERNKMPIIRALSFDSHVLVSGIEVRTGNWPLSQRQLAYYAQIPVYSENFQGPLQSEQERADAVPLRREHYKSSSKPMLIAPPILVQYRNERTRCEGFAASLLDRQVELVTTQCMGSYECMTEGAKLERGDQIRACSGDFQVEGAHFGREVLP
jgi:hypothetical protein